MTENITANIITDSSKAELDWQLDRGAVALMMGVSPDMVDTRYAIKSGQEVRQRYVKRLGPDVGMYDVIFAEAVRRKATLTMDGVPVVAAGKVVELSDDVSVPDSPADLDS
ncbi:MULTISPECIES: hypothetical protein [unclassified Gordonia (in: high G+C Gram-positive bacteria)]|uniref:hypothetical protein n=1 Tax=unclassified Gordonia (in: high G+C Gram-positive bacteria) TaxID=2657482 RepID=UPI0025C1DA06|nr:hypothetical protein [Gordonia sp. UBA7599]